MTSHRNVFHDFSQLAEARSNLYKLFANLYLREPSKELIKKMREKEFLSHFSKVSQGASGVKRLERFLKKFDEENYNELKQEYMNLFTIPANQYVKPYESVYRDRGLVMGESTIAVKKMYKRAGAEISHEYKGLPDHFGLELEFMHFLCQREADAWKLKDKDLVLKYLRVQRAFLEDHLTRWTDDFCSEVAALAKLDFYKGVAEITKGYVTQDLEEVELLTREVETKEI